MTNAANAAGRGSELLLEVRGLSVVYRRGIRHNSALRDVSLRLCRGEAVGVIGETGSGKSTLARAILGLVKPETGRIQFAGEEISGFAARQWRALRRSGGLQYVFQDPLQSLDPDLTVGESIAEPLLLRNGDVASVREAVERSLQRLGLDPALSTRYPNELSGGQRQRVAIARAVVSAPRLLILDEPVSALDSASRVQVLTFLASLRAAGTALLFISHDLGSIAGMTDRIVVLYRGQLVEDRPTAEVVNRPQHPYTQLLVGSVPTLSGGGVPRARRQELQESLTRTHVTMRQEP